MSDNIIINDVRPRIQLVADGTLTEFVFPFAIFEESDLEVYLDEDAQSSGFSVVGAGQSDGGSVIFDTAPTNETVVSLIRRLSVLRTSDFAEGGAFHARVINKELDYMIAVMQETQNDLTRSLKLDATDSDLSLVLPNKAERSGRTLAFDQEGLPTAGPSSDEIVQAQENAQTATQAAILASNAQEAAETARDEAQTFNPSNYRDRQDLITTDDIEDGAITEEKMAEGLALGGPSLGTNSIIRTNATNISEDITIPSGTNGMSAGPITIDEGSTVTLNGTWTIVGS